MLLPYWLAACQEIDELMGIIDGPSARRATTCCDDGAGNKLSIIAFVHDIAFRFRVTAWSWRQQHP